MKTGLVALGVIILIIAFFYFTMRPEYDFENYVFENYSNTNLTTICILGTRRAGNYLRQRNT